MMDVPPASFRGFPTTVRTVRVAGRTLSLLGPRDYEQLLDDPRVVARFAADEYLPYWAEYWPAAVLLADAVAVWGPAGAEPPTVLELGCGLGLVGLVAHALGYDVTITDYDEDALAFVRENARRNGLPPPRVRLVDWRRRYPELRPNRIAAAEVLYEARSLVPLAEFIRAHLDPSGFAVICDANRPTADPFPEIARAAGLRVSASAKERSDPDGGRTIRGRIFHVTLATP